MADVTAAIADALGRLRVASGIDVHPFVADRRLMLGGVEVPYHKGLEGHSDADVLAHAVTDALLGAIGDGDIGSLFPSDDPGLAAVDSMRLLATVVERLAQAGARILNVDVIVIMQSPHVAPWRDAIRESLAHVLDVAGDRVTVRATTTDHLGFVGRGEGAAAHATALVLLA